jgi:hypothetical protein
MPESDEGIPPSARRAVSPRRALALSAKSPRPLGERMKVRGACLPAVPSRPVSSACRRWEGRLSEGAQKFFVVYCEADNDIDRNDVDFPEVLIAVVRQMAAQLKTVGVTLQPSLSTIWTR